MLEIQFNIINILYIEREITGKLFGINLFGLAFYFYKKSLVCVISHFEI